MKIIDTYIRPFAYFFYAFELMGKFVIDNLNVLCHAHHKTHTMEVYDGAEDTKS